MLAKYCGDSDGRLNKRHRARNEGIPLPITQRCIRLAQYSLLHHSINLRRVSRPIEPPSASNSLLADEPEGVGEGIRDGMGEGSLEVVKLFPFERLVSLSLPFAFASLPAAVKVVRFPVPNLLQEWPTFERVLLS